MAALLEWGSYRLDLEKRTHVMGVLNVTPDSFSDGGLFLESEKAIEHGIAMAEEGADFIDIGGESTRPFSRSVSSDEEMERVVPVIEALAREIRAPLSIDTWKGVVAREALKAGASMINDISALRLDPDVSFAAAESGVPVILMHMKGTPENMQKNPVYDDLIGDIKGFLEDAVERAMEAGIREDLILIDPGIGFGKTFDHNLQIIRQLPSFLSLGRPLLIGTSNKAFIGEILGKKVNERMTGTMATVAIAAMHGAHVVRVHNVKEAVETVRMVDAIKRGSVK
ncbi:MAG: dihydropteroate synthase [Deltaproteobacteria bacterium]|nr:dihydropteroate synthase [Deltaproteobacteria bacterium]